jgi:hypothetical protein
MNTAIGRDRPEAGDMVEVAEHRVGGTARVGEILEVIGDVGREHFRVRWDSGVETVLYPSSDVIVRPGDARKKPRDGEMGKRRGNSTT